jgi:hypothetical protein
VTEREPRDRKLFWTEVAVAALLGLAAIAAAWSAYRATLVRDDASSTSTQAIRALNLATGSLLHDDSLHTRNQELFLEYRRALDANEPAQAARVLRDVMRPELRRQVVWWTTQPLGKYPSPFVAEDPFYKPSYLIGGRQARQISIDLFNEGDKITREANRYELMTVILALGLFILGIAAVVKALWFRFSVLGIGAVILVVVSGVLIWLGIRNVHLECTKFLQQVEHACDK